MDYISTKSSLNGRIAIPGSKSHTIRAVLMAALADGESHLIDPLGSSDTEAALHVYGALGTRFELGEKEWVVHGSGGHFDLPDTPLDVGNSGTTLRVALGSLALCKNGETIITGDAQIQQRPSQPLVDALNELGADISSEH
ncbi:MAG: 3-phosphoshikimate 1-carboxyvinyltransferase, partial [Lentisphaeria bacterium]|nr:3-phosphoshikimate 1-carboxyvinyltransferase [Lentisphaeria bacterium]